MEIAGQTAIVTGAASGLGEATARRLAAAGAAVALFDRDLAAAERVAAEIGGQAFACDVADAGPPNGRWPPRPTCSEACGSR